MNELFKELSSYFLSGKIITNFKRRKMCKHMPVILAFFPMYFYFFDIFLFTFQMISPLLKLTYEYWNFVGCVDYTMRHVPNTKYLKHEKQVSSCLWFIDNTVDERGRNPWLWSLYTSGNPCKPLDLIVSKLVWRIKKQLQFLLIATTNQGKLQVWSTSWLVILHILKKSAVI